MEAAGVLPPPDKFGRGPKTARPAAAVASEDDIEADDSPSALRLDDDSVDDDDVGTELLDDTGSDKPPEIDPAA